MGFPSEVVKNILRNFFDTRGVQKGLFGFCGTNFLLVQFGLNRLKMWADVVVVHFELQYFFVADRIGNDIGVQFKTKYAVGGFCTQCIFRENRRTGKPELAELFELLFEVFLSFPKLRTVAFIKDKHYLLAVDGQGGFTFYEVVQFLNSGYDDFIIIFFDVPFESGGAFWTVDAIGGKALILFHGLKIEVFAIHYKEDFINEIKFGCQACRFEACQGFTWSSGMPDKAAAFGGTPVFCLIWTVDFPPNAFGGGNLIGPHDQQSVAHIKYWIAEQYIE